MPYPQLLERKAQRKAYDGMTLFTLTRDLHHVCEDHPVGAAMSRGDVSEQWWVDWLEALRLAHLVIDPELDLKLRCGEHIAEDIAACSLAPRLNSAACEFADSLAADHSMREAAVYVLTGAHLMGGQVMRKMIGERLPTRHLELGDRKGMVALWKPSRDRVDLAEEARAVFRSLLGIMDGIILTKD